LASTGIAPEDDNFHEVGDRWWATETAWFSFHCAERNLGGWLYSLVRPNIGTCAGGAWIWDDSATSPWEVPYSRNLSAMRLPVARDLRSIRLPTGVSIEAVQPLNEYRLRFEDEPHIRIDLRFLAVMPPWPFSHGAAPFLESTHFDQLGRVVGEVTLHGESIPIDCLSVRDRSWGPRPEHRPRRLAYCFGSPSADHAFFITSNPTPDSDAVSHGYLLREGHASDVVAGRRHVERDPANGWITTVSVEGRDRDGRDFHAVGESVSRMAVNRHAAVTWTSLVRWSLDGQIGWGEDQDMWPVQQWSAFHRGLLTLTS
jgi:hypothetical protein